MTIRRLSLLALLLVLWSSPGVAGRKSLHTRFFFTGGTKSYSAETAPNPTPLGSDGGWSCTAGPIELSQLSGGTVVKTAYIECVDTDGSTAKVMATCHIADEDHDDKAVELWLKNAASVRVKLTCYTRRE